MSKPNLSTNTRLTLSTSMSLLNQALAGSGEAWDRIVFLYSPLVCRWCRLRGLQEVEIQDVGQDVFMKLLRNMHMFHRTDPKHSFRKWLKTMTGNMVTDYYRKKNRQPIATGGSSIPDIEDRIPPDDPDEDQKDAFVLMRRCLEMVRVDFQPKTWDAFLAVVVDERSPAEVAASLGMTTTAVYLAKSRISRRLCEMLDRLEQNPFDF